jgi:hypothetical protein
MGVFKHRIANRFLRGFFVQDRRKIDDGNSCGWNAECHARKSSFEFGDHKPDRFGCARFGWDNVHWCRARVPQIFCAEVLQLLRVGVRVHRRQDAAINSEFIIQHFGNRRKTVGRA